MDKLKPCPFCGGEARIYEHIRVGYPSRYGVFCNSCGASSSQYYDSKISLIEAWNRRSGGDSCD